MKNAIIFVLFLLLSTTAVSQTNLQYNLKEGEVYKIKQEAQQVILQEMDGAVHELTNKITGLLEFQVIKERDTTFEIDLFFRDLSLVMTSSIQGELMNVKASEVDENDIQSKIFNSLLNEPVHMILSKNGDILEVTGGDSLVIKMSGASGITDEFSLNMMKKSLEREFGSEALSNSYEQMTFIYPSKPVRVGESWKNEYQGKLSARNSWLLEALSESTATIKGEADITMDVSEPISTMKLDGSQSTWIKTDLLSGFIVSMKVEGSSKGVTIMAQMGNAEIPTSIQSVTTYELIQ
ncbi:DUF6263 family protein [Lentiprolixibacter aurantiacus]|uniref:DUF6263 family protein n=1 Tax=Lentiprolixibacter aurantiacus TaxID=2993939 RepID=A0AAE3SQ75_9FLAO|nr:DUF6263 family protein [Lentiprolixibacter aurantiacus]MCX2720227.1 DUF6263 family protein [Lentiprolixibacter aurantiacus]